MYVKALGVGYLELHISELFPVNNTLASPQKSSSQLLHRHRTLFLTVTFVVLPSLSLFLFSLLYIDDCIRCHLNAMPTNNNNNENNASLTAFTEVTSIAHSATCPPEAESAWNPSSHLHPAPRVVLPTAHSTANRPRDDVSDDQSSVLIDPASSSFKKRHVAGMEEDPSSSSAGQLSPDINESLSYLQDEATALTTPSTSALFSYEFSSVRVSFCRVHIFKYPGLIDPVLPAVA